MEIKQIYDKALAHASYILISEGKAALVDPGRNPQPYLDYAKAKKAEIIAVFETHPHADFVSSHLEFQENHGANIYINPEVGVHYTYKPLSHGDEVSIGSTNVRALFTPGHSPDHNSYLVIDEAGQEHAVFTGDSLFVGDVGRPDLREGTGNLRVSKTDLAGMMYDTLHTVFSELGDEVIVYPAHGPGSLCGKSMSADLHSTISREKKENWAFQLTDKNKFIESYLEGQSFIPKYFPYDVELNRKGAAPMEESIDTVPFLSAFAEQKALIIDVRSQEEFKKGHLIGAINIQNSGENDKFETWLGSIVGPDEKCYLIGDTEEELTKAIYKAARIGYEQHINAAIVQPKSAQQISDKLSLQDFKDNPEQYTIVDIRNTSEVADGKFFEHAINIPLHELRERASEVPRNKPVVVHCAGGYRSAAGSSILAKKLSGATVYDLSEAVADFKP